MPSTGEKEKKYNNGRDISVTCKLSLIIYLRKVKRICGTPLLRAYKWQNFFHFLKCVLTRKLITSKASITLLGTFLWSPLQDCDVRFPNSTWFIRDVKPRRWILKIHRREKRKENFLYRFININSDMVQPKHSTPWKLVHIWQIKRDLTNAIKFERTEIHF